MKGRLAVCVDLKKVVGDSESEFQFLIGWRNEDVLEIVNSVAVRQLDDDGGIDWAAELKYLSESLPSGNVLQVVGICGKWPSEKFNLGSAAALASSSAIQGENISLIASDLVIAQVLECGNIQYHSCLLADQLVTSFPADVVDDPCSDVSIAAETMCCRVTMKLGFSFAYSSRDAAASCASLGTEFARIDECLLSERSGFFVGSTLLARDDSGSSVGDAFPRSAAAKSVKTEPLLVARHTYLMSAGGDGKDHVPVFVSDTCVEERVHVSCPLDALVVIRRSSSTLDLHAVCTSALLSQLASLYSRMEATLQAGSNPQTYAPLHFSLPHVPHHKITVIYPSRQLQCGEPVAEESLEATRRELHHRFNLPFNQPLLRRHMHVGAPVSAGQYLTNVHNGINLSSSTGGTVSLVQGTYTYHHYMQDRFNDDGWGCAYRSLQTLWSWFKHQGYTGLPVPTHKEIQQALVDVEDKPAKFVGSRQWIGSIEVQTVLNQLLQVDSRILFVMTGAAMPNNAREIAMHFQQQGTPIMIGGGTLAHTILGIDFNDRTGDVRFLILDPHFTGGEDLGHIVTKGWCGWKNASFWDQQAHYNMCMPLRPNVI